MPELAAFFQSVKLPVMSEVAHALIQTLQDDDVSTSLVSDILSRDPSLTAKLLRLANTARFGQSRGVSSIDDAISLVGMSQVRTLGLAACMNESFPMVQGLDRMEFWQNSMACAGYAKWMAGHLGVDSQQAWLAGMMVRLGELLIGQSEPAKLVEIEQQPHLPGGRWEREHNLLGLSEGQITAELARRWNFPKEIVIALDASSDPLAAHPFSRLAGIVHLAGLLADSPGDDPELLDSLPVDVVHTLQMNLESMRSKFPSHDSFVDVTSM